MHHSSSSVMQSYYTIEQGRASILVDIVFAGLWEGLLDLRHWCYWPIRHTKCQSNHPAARLDFWSILCDWRLLSDRVFVLPIFAKQRAISAFEVALMWTICPDNRVILAVNQVKVAHHHYCGDVDAKAVGGFEVWWALCIQLVYRSPFPCLRRRILTAPIVRISNWL